MVKVTIEFDKSAVDDIPEKTEAIIKKGKNLVAQNMIRNLAQNSPVDTGKLKGWFPYRNEDTLVEIRSPAEYAGYVNDGTGIYGPRGQLIYRKDIGKPFAFNAGGKMVYVKYIKGQKGQHFVERSIEQTSSNLQRLFNKAVLDVMGNG